MKFKPWAKDATTGEKITNTAILLFVVGLYMFMQLSAWQVFENLYSKECALAPVFFHALGGVLSILSITGIYLMIKDKIGRTSTGAGMAAVGVLTALTFLSYAGFYAYGY